MDWINVRHDIVPNVRAINVLTFGTKTGLVSSRVGFVGASNAGLMKIISMSYN
ncbi:hypothetical protein CLV98_105165 [Dyadobacter jejuensis]|uniref:Uncharacterized protein n=1 Tax=Dyadobacter jejuensis TaxID=1082580 RepID=A0A316AJI7_9BACT|nr:hypothetical protein CLV98_105165 [Dyadobacter jejuensis]